MKMYIENTIKIFNILYILWDIMQISLHIFTKHIEGILISRKRNLVMNFLLFIVCVFHSKFVCDDV